MTATTLTTGAMYLKRGDTFDPEDWRMTHRLQVARTVLAALGIEPTPVHKGSTADRPGGAEHRYVCGSGIGCGVTWDEELATPEVFNAAFALANALQNARSARTAHAVNEYELAKMAAGRVVE